MISKGTAFNAISLFLAIFGVVFGIYSYMSSQRYVKPVFLVDPIRTEILSIDRLGDTPIKIVKSNGDVIKRDVTSVRFYFWNDGNESIKKEHILRPIIVDLVGSDIEILDYNIVRFSRDVIEASVNRNEERALNSLNLRFSILEPGDGFSVQILFSGERYSELKISGVIEKSTGILSNSDVSKKQTWIYYFAKLFTVVLFVAVLWGVSIFLGWFDKYRDNLKSDNVKTIIGYSSKLFSWVLIVILVSGVFLAVLFNPYLDAKDEAESSITTIVPASILPKE